MTTKDKIIREIKSWVPYICIAIAASFLIIKFVGQRTIVIGISMEDTLHDAEQLIVEKISYRFSEPERFDIIVFPNPLNEEENYIKRIIGLPGETIQVKEGYVYINGEQLEEHYGKEVMQHEGIAEYPVVLGEDEYFVLGDNRNSSKDSRAHSVGAIHRQDIIGKAWVRIYPFDKMKVITHE